MSNGFFGAAEARLGTHDVIATVTRYPAGVSLTQHAHATPYLSFVLSGSYVERIGRTALSCQHLTVRFHPAGEEHSNTFGPMGGRCLNLELTPRWRESLERLRGGGREPLILFSAGGIGLRIATLCARRKARMRRRGTVDSSLEIEGLVAELLASCEVETRRHCAAENSPAMRRAIDLVEGASLRHVSLAEVAAEAGLHPTHFARKFRALVGVTLGEYVRRRRVARAESLFASNPTATVSRIAAETGFADHAHLTRTFRATTGIVPSVFRAALEREMDSAPSRPPGIGR